MEYKEFTKRYFDGELSSAEEQTLREVLMATADENLTSDERAAKALLRYASLKSDASVRIRLAVGAPAPSASMEDAIRAISVIRLSSPSTFRGMLIHILSQTPCPLYRVLAGSGVICGLVIAVV